MLSAFGMIYVCIPLQLGLQGSALTFVIGYSLVAALIITGGRWAEVARTFDPVEFAAEAWVNGVGIALTAVPLFAVGAGARLV